MLAGTRNDSYSSQSYVESNFDYSVSRYDIDLKVIDIEASKAFDLNCDSNMSVFSGFRFAFLDQDLHTVYGNKADIATDHTAVLESNKMDAYGLYIGGEGLWSICGNFGFFGRFSAGTFVADISRSFHQHNLNSNVIFEVADATDSSWCHVNAIEFALGIDYQLCRFFCADWNVRIGYELNTWFNMHDFLNFCGTNAGVEGHPARQKDSIGFDGLFVRLGASF